MTFYVLSGVGYVEQFIIPNAKKWNTSVKISVIALITVKYLSVNTQQIAFNQNKSIHFFITQSDSETKWKPQTDELTLLPMQGA